MSAMDARAVPGSRTGQLSWPIEARSAMSSLEYAAENDQEKRNGGRRRYRVAASFMPTGLASDPQDAVFYTRDVSAFALGFISTQPLEAGQRGRLRLPMPSGAVTFVPVTVRRCREFKPGWFEGVVHFASEQAVFAEEQESPEADEGY